MNRAAGMRALRFLPVGLIALMAMVPVFAVIASIGEPMDQAARHVMGSVVRDVGTTSVLLALGVAVGTLLIGVPLAWFVSIHDFPFRRILSWALLLPLVMPAYVLAFVSVGFFDYSGLVQQVTRSLGLSPFFFDGFRTLPGAAFILSLSLYPYVYALARTAFATQGRRMQEAANMLGASPLRGFFRVALPMARPWVAAGVLLAVMETLADFGAVSVLGVDTFTTAIYKAWFGMFSLTAALKLSSVLLVLAGVLLVAEQESRRHMRYTPAERSSGAPVPRIRLAAPAGIAVAGFGMMVVLAGFVIPVVQLLAWALEAVGIMDMSSFIAPAINTLMLASVAAALVTSVSLILALARRAAHSGFIQALIRLSTTGYAVPGTILAVGLFMPVARFSGFLSETTGVSVGLQNTVTVMLIGYLVRYLAVGYGSVDGALSRVSPSVLEAGKMLGHGPVSVTRRITIPLVRPGLVTALVLVFVDVAKELPITLMTRPFGRDTLAVKIFEYTAEGEWERAAIPALALVAAGCLPVAIMAVSSRERE